MIRHFAREIRDISVETFDITVDTLTKFFREIGELGEAPDRTRQGIVAACSVVLATFLALLLEIQSPWWAAISAFMSLSATGGGSLRRGILRLTGTAAGALLGFVMARWLPYDHFAMYLFIGGVTMLGVIAMQVSPHGLAWLFLCITSILVLLESLTNPLQAASVAYYRMFEVGIGVLSAIIVANLLQDWHREPAPTAPGWRTHHVQHHGQRRHAGAEHQQQRHQPGALRRHPLHQGEQQHDKQPADGDDQHFAMQYVRSLNEK